MQMLGLDSGLKPMAIMPDVKVCPTDAVGPSLCNDIAQCKCHLACRGSFAMLYLHFLKIMPFRIKRDQ